MPAASLDQVYVICPSCDHVAVARLAPQVRRAEAQAGSSHLWFAGSLLLVGLALVLAHAL
jgi:hypothetical protein